MEKLPLLSSDERLLITFLSYKEPNPGRMLWEVEVRLDDEIINEVLFGERWNVINFETKDLEISNNQSFYYIPIESSAKLIDSNKELIKLKYQNISTARFKGNKFSEDYLMEIFNDEISLTHLSTFQNSTFKTQKGEWIF
ncbi:MAG: hypothetical protein ACI94Y_000878 [Maribacter sp.]|jgi:hypothetical protein